MSDSTSILDQLTHIQASALDELQQVKDEAGLQAWKAANLGRSSAVMQVFSKLSQASKEERPAIGQRANQVKLALESAFAARSETIKEESLLQALQAERLDVTLPGRPHMPGRLHLETRTLREIYRLFGEMGFQVYRSPDVETDENNFSLLNIPEYHPARDMFDTFHTTTPGVVLRTHTSPGQIRAMREFAPDPIRVILPGMVYRYEQVTVRADIQFYQVEVLAVGRHITFGDLKGTLSQFARRMYGADVRLRFRPSYFPFTEPSAELDVECFICGGKGCPVCKQSGWLEILGSGMIHPTVLQNGGYDPREFSGFAAGMGSGRIGMLRHKINDIRNLWVNDMRFLEQF
jgi:phenylalanyl-tRNA synthetase alpha chain